MYVGCGLIEVRSFGDDEGRVVSVIKRSTRQQREAEMCYTTLKECA